MPRPRPPHLQREITRHGKAVWYVRVDRGPRVRLKAEFGTPEFDAEYRAALAGNQTEVSLPILPVLQATLDAGPCGDLAFICGERGEPLTKESFGNVFKAACKAAGVPGSAHGVRKIAATRAADAGATDAELMAIFGWTDPKMPALYTKTANRKRLAVQAMSKLGTSIPAPCSQVREKARKT